VGVPARCRLRIGELVWLRWASVDLDRRAVHIVDFVSTLGYDLVPSSGKSREAVRTIELDDGLVGVLPDRIGQALFGDLRADP